MQVGYRQKSWFWSNSWLSIDCWTCELRSDKNSHRRPCSVATHSRRLTSECLFVTACSMDEYAEEKRTEKNLIGRSGISEAETTNNKRLRSTFCIEAIQTRSIVRPLCDSRASCPHNDQDNKWRGYTLVVCWWQCYLEVCVKHRQITKYIQRHLDCLRKFFVQRGF